MSSARRNIPRTTLERDAAHDARRIHRRLGDEIRTMREDAGISLSRLAAAAGIAKSHLHGIENGAKHGSFEALGRIAGSLGADLSVRLYPGSGPRIRDHIQAAMLQALVAMLHPRWRATPEVPVGRPGRGFIDLVLDGPDQPLVACEAHSQLRRLEQQVR